MIRYPFLIDQVLILNERNGTNIVLSRDEARQLYEQLGRIDMTPATKRKIHAVIHNAEWTKSANETFLSIRGEVEADIANTRDGSTIITGRVVGRWKNIVHTVTGCYYIASWKK